MHVSRHPGEDPPCDAEEASANIDDRLKEMYMSREAVIRHKMRRVLQQNDTTGGTNWKTDDLGIDEENLVDALLLSPEGKAVPGDGVSHDMTASLATMPMTSKPRATGIPRQYNPDSHRSQAWYTLNSDGSKTPEATGYGYVITSNVDDTILAQGKGSLEENDGINVFE